MTKKKTTKIQMTYTFGTELKELDDKHIETVKKLLFESFQEQVHLLKFEDVPDSAFVISTSDT